MINRNAYHNAMRCGTLLSANRSDAPLSSSPLSSSPLNDLFVLLHRCSACRCAPRLCSTQRFVCYQRIASLRPAPQLRSTICLLSAQLSYANRTLTKRNAAPLNSAQRFVYYQRLASLRTAPPLCSTICLSQRAESIRGSRPLNSTQRFVYYYASRRNEPQRYSTPRNASQLNNLFVIDASPLCSTRQCAAKRNETQRNST